MIIISHGYTRDDIVTARRVAVSESRKINAKMYILIISPTNDNTVTTGNIRGDVIYISSTV